MQELPVPLGTGETMFGAMFSPRADFLGVLVKGAPARIVNVSGREPEPVAVPFSGAVFGMAFRPLFPEPAGNRLRCREAAFAFGEADNLIGRCDLRLGERLPGLFLPRACCVAYSNDGRFIAGGGLDGLVSVWSLEREVKEVVRQKVSTSRVTGLAFNSLADCIYVVTGVGEALRVALPHATDIRPCLVSKSDRNPLDWDIYSVDTHPTATLVAFGGLGNRVRLANSANGKVDVIESELGAFVRQVKFLPTQQHLCLVGETGVEVWKLPPPRTLENVCTRVPPVDRVWAVEMRDDVLVAARA